MQALVARDAGYPDDKIICSISGCDPRGTPSALTLAPSEHDRGRICCSNFIGPDGTGIVVKANVRPLTCVIRNSRCSSVNATHIRLVHGPVDAAEIVAINQVSIRIFTKSKHKLRRRSSRHIDHRRADAAQIGIRVIEREPVGRRPIVSRHDR